MNEYFDFRDLNKILNEDSVQKIMQSNNLVRNPKTIDIPRMSEQNMSQSFLSRDVQLSNKLNRTRNLDIEAEFNLNSKHQLEKFRNNLPEHMKPGMKKEEINKRLNQFERLSTKTQGHPFIKQNPYLDMTPENTRDIYES